MSSHLPAVSASFILLAAGVSFGQSSPTCNNCTDGPCDLGTLSAAGGSFLGETTFLTNDFENDGPPCGENNLDRRDAIYKFSVEGSGLWRFQTESSFMIREDTGAGCPGEWLGCASRSPFTFCDGPPIVLEFHLSIATRYFIVVDGPGGVFEVEYGQVEPVCSTCTACTSNADCFCLGGSCETETGVCLEGTPPCDPVQHCDEENHTCIDPDPCLVFRNTNGRFSQIPTPDSLIGALHFADDVSFSDFTGRRELISYEMLVVCSKGIFGAVDTGPFDATLQLWDHFYADWPPYVSGPGDPIPGTKCEFTDIPCGNGIIGDPNQSISTRLVCDKSNGVADNVALRHSGDIVDLWIVSSVTSDASGPGLMAGYCSDPADIGGSLNIVAHSFNGSFRDDLVYTGGSFVSSICAVPEGPCCHPTCETEPEEDCLASGGTYLGDSTALDPKTCGRDEDRDSVSDPCDNCPTVSNPLQLDCDQDAEGDACEADPADRDDDFDGVCNGIDECPDDPSKSQPGQCGCGSADDDKDGDGSADCNDGCPDDAAKTDPGFCGCGQSDVGDTDGDGFPDCVDQCRGVDDAVFAPECAVAIPALSQWGMVILTLLLLTIAKSASCVRGRESPSRR